MNRPHLHQLILIAAALFGLLMSATGCGAGQLPKPLMRAERTRLAESHFNLTIGVIREKHNWRRSAAGAVKAIRRLKLFDRVDYLDAYGVERPDLIADFDDILVAMPLVPIATLLTIGFVPTEYTEKYGLAVTFRPNEDRAASPAALRVEFSYEATGIIGWLGIPLWILPEWGIENPHHHRRMYQRLGLEIIEHEQEIRALAAAGRPKSGAD